jgi:hypothetical protein
MAPPPFFRSRLLLIVFVRLLPARAPELDNRGGRPSGQPHAFHFFSIDHSQPARWAKIPQKKKDFCALRGKYRTENWSASTKFHFLGRAVL